MFLLEQALEKADEAKNIAGKSVDVISTTMISIDNILAQIGQLAASCCNRIINVVRSCLICRILLLCDSV